MYEARLTTIPMVYSYSRVSSMGQTTGHGLDRQEASSATFAQDYASRHGMKLAPADSQFGNMQDKGKSAWKGTHRKKGAFGAFLKAVDAGNIAPGSTFVCEEIDRFSREAGLIAWKTLITFWERGITIVTTFDGGVYPPDTLNDLAKAIVLQVRIQAAHDYSNKLSFRVGKELADKMVQARATGKILSRNCPAWLTVSPDGSRFDVLPDRAEIVRQIFAYAASGMGSHAIAARLNDSGLPAFNAAKWSNKAVNYMVTARSPMGELTPANGAPLANYYPAIVTLETWTAAQQARAANNTAKVGSKVVSGLAAHNLFSGLLACSACGGKMKFNAGRKHAGGAPRFRLHCINALDHACAASGSIRYPALESAVINRLGYMDQAGLLNDTVTDHGADLELEVSRLSLAIESANQELDAITSGFGANIPAAIIASMGRKATAIAALESRLADAKAALCQARPVISVEDHKAALADLKAKALAGDYEARVRVRTALRNIIARIECDVEAKLSKVVLTVNDRSFYVDNEGLSGHMDQAGQIVMVAIGQDADTAAPYRVGEAA